MNELESARRIIDALRNDKVLTLKELARRAGFLNVASRDFKVGFNWLQKQGAVKLRQSGWPSEKRGGHNHPKQALLVADVYELDNAEREIHEELGDLEEDVTQQSSYDLIPAFTPFGHRTFVSKEEYEAVKTSKNKGLCFWRLEAQQDEKRSK
jgi:hypothetical protein